MHSPYSVSPANLESSKPVPGILASADNIYQQIRRQIDDLSPITKNNNNNKNKLDNLKYYDDMNVETNTIGKESLSDIPLDNTMRNDLNTQRTYYEELITKRSKLSDNDEINSKLLSTPRDAMFQNMINKDNKNFNLKDLPIASHLGKDSHDNTFN